MKPTASTSPDNLVNRTISRRAMLRGLGVTMALPLMESLGGFNRLAAAGIDTVKAGPPRRYGTMLFANGVNTEHWWAKQTAGGMELSKTLAPLARFKDDILPLNGLEYFGSGSATHWPLFTNFLSGADLQKSTLPMAAKSIDQVIAAVAGKETFLPSLHLGVDPVQPGLRLGVPAIYYSTVSWSSAQSPIPPEIYPRAAFDRLFDKTSLIRDKSVLDVVLGRSKRLRRDLAGYDRHKLDEFMENVRSVERRIERATSEERLEGWQPSLEEPNIKRPGEKAPQDFADHSTIMLDLLVLAFQMDRTRVATMIMENDSTGRKFDFIKGVGGAGMHSISHHGNDGKTLAEYQKINQWHVEQLAYVLEKMQGIDEGNGSLLDNTMLLFGSNMMDGNGHDGRQLPLILCGGRNCGIMPGRVLTYEDEKERRLTNLHLACAHRMGVGLTSFGDSVGPLKGIEG